MDWDKVSKMLANYNWIILMVLGSASFFLMSPLFTLGVILGGLIIIANFKLLQHTIRSAFASGGALKTNKVSIIGKYYFRLAIMGIIIYILVTNGWVDPIGLVIGLSIVVFSIVLMGVRAAWKISSGEAL
jgi:hypothetical protein